MRGSGTKGRLPSQQQPDDAVNVVGGVRGEDKTMGVVVETAAVAAAADATDAAINRRLRSSRLLLLLLLLLLLQLPLLMAPCAYSKNQLAFLKNSLDDESFRRRPFVFLFFPHWER